MPGWPPRGSEVSVISIATWHPLPATSVALTVAVSDPGRPGSFSPVSVAHSTADASGAVTAPDAAGAALAPGVAMRATDAATAATVPPARNARVNDSARLRARQIPMMVFSFTAEFAVVPQRRGRGQIRAGQRPRRDDAPHRGAVQLVVSLSSCCPQGSLERGLAVSGAFTPDRPALGISELARELTLTRSTTHRYVATLASLGFLDQDASTRKYRLGPRVLDLGFSVLGSLGLREIAAPHLRRLADATGHTSNLAIRDDTDVILIDRVRGRPGRYHHLEFALHAGSRIPAYCSATGKVLLAFLPGPPRR
jgi:IclR helix-turn-helix domain/Bacterial transcriptional regulator